MHVFVLCTGRSGSTSFVKACKHITNFTSGHESKSHFTGQERFVFPENHIEADNRLSWQLGQLDQYYGKKAYYIHLKRDKEATANSFMNRFLLPKSMIYAYANGIKKSPPERLSLEDRFEICLDYVETINANIEVFIKDKPLVMTIELSNIQSGFKAFWTTINAEGDVDKALSEFDKKHNKSSKKTIDIQYSLKNQWLKSKMFLKHIFN